MHKFEKVVLFAVLAGATRLSAQTVVLDTACYRPLAAAVDSLGKLHLASTVTTTYQRRAIQTLTSAHTLYCSRVVTPPAPDTTVAQIDVSFDRTTTVSWLGGRQGLPQAVDAPLCGTVAIGGVPYLGDSAVLATIVSQDSVAFRPAVLPDTAALRALCVPLFPSLPVATMPWVSVVWSSARVAGAELSVAVPVVAAR